jgi:hypothetical protein
VEWIRELAQETFRHVIPRHAEHLRLPPAREPQRPEDRVPERKEAGEFLSSPSLCAVWCQRWKSGVATRKPSGPKLHGTFACSKIE